MASTEQVRYPNQKQIKIKKVEIEKGDYYLRVRKDALQRAAQMLDAGPFKLFIYLADNMDGYKLNLSPKAVENCFGMKLKQYRNAVDKLKETGYLYQPDPSKENYVFFEGGRDSIDDIESDNAAIYPKGIDPKGIDPKGIEILPKKEVSSTQNGQFFFPKDIEKEDKIIEIIVDNRTLDRQTKSSPYLDEIVAKLDRRNR